MGAKTHLFVGILRVTKKNAGSGSVIQWYGSADPYIIHYRGNLFYCAKEFYYFAWKARTENQGCGSGRIESGSRFLDKLGCRPLYDPLPLTTFILQKCISAIYGPMIYTALYVMLLMRATSITRASGRRLVPGNPAFFGPSEMASSR